MLTDPELTQSAYVLADRFWCEAIRALADHNLPSELLDIVYFCFGESLGAILFGI